ncbi:MAG: serine/threonine-protein kinase, partial [Gordonia sp. (in: high G+C Gram-positive bacteria)]
MTRSDRSGTTIGRYRLTRLLGRGGMGEVYEAVDTDKDRVVALKLLPVALSEDGDFRARFLRESQTVARLNDPHIIPIHDFGELDGQLFLDMRIVHGRDLRSIIASGPLPPERAVAVIEQVAAALDTAHATGLLHRDVKPENILLDARDFAYLADFGLAQSAGQTRLTATGTAIGSFAYMAPERFGADTAVGPAADVYSLACVLYECLTGAQPFPSASIEQIIAGHLSRPIPATGTAFDAVIAAGTAKNPAERLASAGAFAAAARQALVGRGA